MSAITRRQSLIDGSVHLGIAVLALGVLVSVANDFCPGWFHWLGQIAAPLTRAAFPMLPPLTGMAQLLCFAGAVILLAAPIYSRAWIFIVLQTMAAVSCLIPILELSTVHEAILRLLLTYCGIGALILLRQVEASSLWRVVMPHYWVQCLIGRHGPMPTCIVGSEFLGWGYAMMGTSPLLAYFLVFTGSVFLTRFAFLGMKQHLPLAHQWYVLNWIYVVGFGAKLFLRAYGTIT
jgi:hypothetical protein